jgi:hypothetical protein
MAKSEMANKIKKNEQPGISRNQTILSRRLNEEEILEVLGILGYANFCCDVESQKQHTSSLRQTIGMMWSK